MTTRDAPLVWIRAVQDSTSPGTRLDLLYERITAMTFEDDERKADKFTLTVDNYDVAMYDEPAFKKGLTLDVQWGYVGNMAPARRGVVQSMKGGLTITIECIARSILMNKIVKTRTFENVRHSDVIRTIATENGYGPDVLEIDETAIVYPQVAQARMTDAQLMKRLSVLEGFEFYVDHLGLHFHAQRLDQNPAKTLRWFSDRTGEIQEFFLDNDITAKRGRRRARGRDPMERTEIDEASSDSEDTSGDSLAEIVEYLDREANAFNEVDANTVSEEVVSTTAQTSVAAATQTRGRFRQNKLVAIKLKLTIIGDPQIQAKTIIKVEGLGQRISGLYYIRKVVSSVGDGGFTQTLECISNGTGGHARRSRLGDLELPSRGVPTAGNTRPASREQDPGALAEEQVHDEETNTYHTVYSSTAAARPARRGTPPAAEE